MSGLEGSYAAPPARAEAEAKRVFDFSDALRFVRLGIPVQRQGWNGKGMWLGFCVRTHLVIHGGDGAAYTEAPSQPFIVMRTADRKYVPWLASQTDLLATDWQVLPPREHRPTEPGRMSGDFTERPQGS